MSKRVSVNLNLRCPEALRDAIKEYAEQRGTNLTQLTLNYYRHLLEQENVQEAEQA